MHTFLTILAMLLETPARFHGMNTRRQQPIPARRQR